MAARGGSCMHAACQIAICVNENTVRLIGDGGALGRTESQELATLPNNAATTTNEGGKSLKAFMTPQERGAMQTYAAVVELRLRHEVRQIARRTPRSVD